MLAFFTKRPAGNFKWCLILAFLSEAVPTSLLAAGGVTLYTPYTKISVPPGESISYDIDVINKSGAVAHAAMAISGLPRGWSYSMKSGGWTVSEISVLPREKKTVNFQVQVPLQVNKGTYHFMVTTRGAGKLPLTVVVSQQGTFKSEFTSGQSNMEGAANSTFTYTATLRNGTGADQVYTLNPGVPPGWSVTFKADYKQVSSVSVEANKSKDITIEVDPPDETPAGNYKIPVRAATNNTFADLTLDLKITGSYGMQLATPEGLLSTKTTAGDSKHLALDVRNTGSAPLKNIELQATAPANWEVTFEPQKLEALEPGASARVTATIKADKKAIAGDYMVEMDAKSAEISSKAEMRVTVETSLLSGWLGLFVILLAIGGVYYLFRKYGRR